MTTDPERAGVFQRRGLGVSAAGTEAPAAWGAVGESETAARTLRKCLQGSSGVILESVGVAS